MEKSKTMENLFAEFPPITTEQWIERIKKDLKTDNLNKLIRTTIDGIKFQPFYRKENTENLSITDILPKEAPYIRGYKNNNDWTIRLNIYFTSPNETNKKIINLIANGVDSIGIDFGETINLEYENFEKLINNINVEKNPIHFIALYNPEKIIPLLTEYANRHNINIKTIQGSINFDPYTKIAFTGIDNEILNDLDSILLLLNSPLEHFKTLSINTEKYANAGASAAQQIAFALAIAEEYINFATEQNFKIQDVIKKFIFNFAVNSEYLLEIAKFAAFRYLYGKFIGAYDKNLEKQAIPFIHAITTRRNKTIYDPYVNMIRTTVEGLAAAIAGADIITVEPFDIIFRKPDEFSERIAKNQQLILKHEAFIDKVIDPTGGSFYIENVKYKLIEKAWEIFLQIQKQGGFLKALKNNFIYQEVKKINDKEIEAVKKGKISILGTNKYPNKNETLKGTKIEIPPEYQENPDKKFNALKTKRLAEIFEQIRIKTEKAKKIPQVFLFPYGKIAMRRARADFASNFFAIAGFHIVDNIGFQTIEEGLNQWETNPSEITVLCANDELYLEMANIIYPKLKDKTIIVIAGNPQTREDLEKIGIKHFIHRNSNIYDELIKFQNLTNI